MPKRVGGRGAPRRLADAGGGVAGGLVPVVTTLRELSLVVLTHRVVVRTRGELQAQVQRGATHRARCRPDGESVPESHLALSRRAISDASEGIDRAPTSNASRENVSPGGAIRSSETTARGGRTRDVPTREVARPRKNGHL